MAGVSVDTSELASLARSFTAAARDVAAQTRPVVSKGALNVKNQLREEMSASASFRGVARSISYDLLERGLTAEIGPTSEAGSAGNLANIAYFGSSRGGGTVPDPQGALDAEAPRFEQALADVMVGLLR